MTANKERRVTQHSDSQNLSSDSEHARTGGDRVLRHEREEAEEQEGEVFIHIQ
jgi:hypothetical protein